MNDEQHMSSSKHTNMNIELWSLLVLISFLWNPALSYFVKRFLNQSETDIHSSPDNSTCHKYGCVKSLGQKVCQNCCDCRCQNGIYLSRNEVCVEDKDLYKSCTVLLGNHSSLSINKVSPQMMKSGQDVSFCNVPHIGCSGRAKHCEIIRTKTLFDNYNWKWLWPKESDMDFEIKQNATSGVFVLFWNQRKCNRNKYNGLLIRLRISCVFDDAKPPMLLCIHLIFPGTFTLGTNPLDRTNCTGATTSSKITIDDGASMASVTTKAVTYAAAETSTASSYVFGTSSNGVSSAKCHAFLNVGWYVAGAAIAVLLLVAIVIMWRRRKDPPPQQPPRAEGNNVDNAVLSQLQSPKMFPMQTNLGPSDSSYIVPARNAMATAAFGSHVEEEYYDQPIMQRCTPVEKLYAALEKEKRLALMETGKKRSFIKTVSLPVDTQTTGNNSTFELTGDDDASMEEMYLKVLSLPEEKEWIDMAYQDSAYVIPNGALIGSHNSVSDSNHSNEPIYMDC